MPHSYSAPYMTYFPFFLYTRVGTFGALKTQADLSDDQLKAVWDAVLATLRMSEKNMRCDYSW